MPDPDARVDFRALEVGIKELTNATSKVIRRAEAGERVLITKRGRPVAVLMSIPAAEQFVVAYAEEFVRARLAGREEQESGATVALDEM